MPNSLDEYSPVTHDDIMKILRESQKKGFAFKDLTNSGPKGEFARQDIWKHDPSTQIPTSDINSKDVQKNDLSSDPNQDLAELVSERLQPDSLDESIVETAPSPSGTIADTATLKPQDTKAAQTTIRTLGYDEGFDHGQMAGYESGFQMGLKQGYTDGTSDAISGPTAHEIEQLQNARLTFEQIVTSLNHIHSNELNEMITTLLNTVNLLASERAGIAIDDHPNHFSKRIEMLSERLTHIASEITLSLNPQDYDAIQNQIKDSEILSEAKINTDGSLGRGDTKIKVGAITLSDILAPRE